MAKTEHILERCAETARTAFPDAAVGHLPRDAALYLAHVEGGESLRALADAAGRHPSTVMRAVRRVEARRDDPLFDEAIGAAAGGVAPAEPDGRAPETKGVQGPLAPAAERPSEAEVARAGRRLLRRLSEPGAFLLARPEMERAGIFCTATSREKPIAVTSRAMAGEFLRRDWIALAARGRASLRYRITEAGRAALKRLLAEDRERKARAAPGLAEAQTPFQAQHRLEGERLFADPEGGAPVRARVNLGESPLGWLARRKGPDGAPFLTPAEVEAGERLAEDFEAAQLGPSVAQDWRRFLAPVDATPHPGGGSGGSSAARDRASAALSALGPGLADVALRVCCFHEGLEACEKRMGWSARSGKVVLKIALQRLAAHYGLASGSA